MWIEGCRTSTSTVSSRGEPFAYVIRRQPVPEARLASAFRKSFGMSAEWQPDRAPTDCQRFVSRALNLEFSWTAA